MAASLPVASLAVAPAVEAKIAEPKPARTKSAHVRPPARPASLAQAAPPAPHPTHVATSRGFELGKFVPTGSDIIRGIGAVGQSIGKIIRISAR